MCPHGRAVDLHEFCPQCIGPRDVTRGMRAVAQCPWCLYPWAEPEFYRDGEGYTVTILVCLDCGGVHPS